MPPLCAPCPAILVPVRDLVSGLNDDGLQTPAGLDRGTWIVDCEIEGMNGLRRGARAMAGALKPGTESEGPSSHLPA